MEISVDFFLLLHSHILSAHFQGTEFAVILQIGKHESANFRNCPAKAGVYSEIKLGGGGFSKNWAKNKVRAQPKNKIQPGPEIQQ